VSDGSRSKKTGDVVVVADTAGKTEVVAGGFVAVVVVGIATAVGTVGEVACFVMADAGIEISAERNFDCLWSLVADNCERAVLKKVCYLRAEFIELEIVDKDSRGTAVEVEKSYSVAAPLK